MSENEYKEAGFDNYWDRFTVEDFISRKFK